MPTGIELYNRDGSTALTMTDRVLKIIGSVTLPANSSGSFGVGEYASGLNVPGYIFRPVDGQAGASTFCPNISISGTTVNWSSGPVRGMSPPRAVVIEVGYF